MKPFSQLSQRGQAGRLRPLAEEVLGRYDLAVRRLRLLSAETNCVFRVESDRGVRVLRISMPVTGHGLEDTRAEVAWLDAVSRDTTIGVPRPVPTHAGDLVTTASREDVPETRTCVLFGWQPGVDLDKRLTPVEAERLGALTAHLHEYALRFEPPKGFRIRPFDRVFPYANETFPNPEPVVLFEDRFADLFAPAIRSIYERAVARCAAEHERLLRETPPRVIHTDLHPWNVVICRGRLAALDFEDIMWGHPAQDVAATFYYFQRRTNGAALQTRYEEGYRAVAPWPFDEPEQLNVLVAGRALVLVNYVLTSDQPWHREMAKDYVTKVGWRLQQLLR